MKENASDNGKRRERERGEKAERVERSKFFIATVSLYFILCEPHPSECFMLFSIGRWDGDHVPSHNIVRLCIVSMGITIVLDYCCCYCYYYCCCYFVIAIDAFD